MNEAETRAQLIDPHLLHCGWNITSDIHVYREFKISDGRINMHGARRNARFADYILSYNHTKLGVIEAKSSTMPASEGAAQAKLYAQKLCLPYAYATNGKEIYQICMSTGEETYIDTYPSPKELWDMAHAQENEWHKIFARIPLNTVGNTKVPRFYQEIAVEKVLKAISQGQKRILLTLATGTGKTHIAFQIAWKLFQARWNIRQDKKRIPRMLFLTDRNILANQAFNAFNAFDEDALIRIAPDEIRKNNRVPKNGSIFFTIFQTFMTTPDNKNSIPCFGEYPPDFFDCIIIDECHRGGAHDESNWRGIMEYFTSAVQLGLTATPKKQENANTYAYFGEPVYEYSLKEGINDGYLTPFRVNKIQTTLDEYQYTPDDTVIEGEIDTRKIYDIQDFNNNIIINEREKEMVHILLSHMHPNEKTIVFCRDQKHALTIRDFINQQSESKNPDYCHRVTADDGKIGEQHLLNFQDNEKTIPTILTTSHKLSTGVDARNIRNIVLLRPINSMIEFKQIIGRGTRLFEKKYYFTIHDFVGAYHHFADPEWDGEPEEVWEEAAPDPTLTNTTQEVQEMPSFPYSKETPTTIVVKLSDGKARNIQHMLSTDFFDNDGIPISAEMFLEKLYGKLPTFFRNEDDLRRIWSDPSTRETLLDTLKDAGYDKEALSRLQQIVNAEKSDLFDVLEYVAAAIPPITRKERVAIAHDKIFETCNEQQRQFIEFVLSQYINVGYEELSQAKLTPLLELKYGSIQDAKIQLGIIDSIKSVFIEFQKYLYEKKSA